jgi:hypothetical protein
MREDVKVDGVLRGNSSFAISLCAVLMALAAEEGPVRNAATRKSSYDHAVANVNRRGCAILRDRTKSAMRLTIGGVILLSR